MMPFRAAMPEHGHEADERAEGEDAAAQEGPGHAADEREREVTRTQERQPERAGSRRGGPGGCRGARAPRGRGAAGWPRRARRTRRGTRGGTRGRSESRETRASISRATRPRSAADVAGDVDAARGALALDLVRRGGDDDVRDVAPRGTCPPEGVSIRRSRSAARSVRRPRARPRRRRRRPSGPRRSRRPSSPCTSVATARRTSSRGDAVDGGRLRAQAHLDLRHEDLRLHLQVRDARDVANGRATSCGLLPEDGEVGAVDAHHDASRWRRSAPP